MSSENVVKLPPSKDSKVSTGRTAGATAEAAASGHSVLSEDLEALENDFFAEVLNGKKKEEQKVNGDHSANKISNENRRSAGNQSSVHGRHKNQGGSASAHNHRRDERQPRKRHPFEEDEKRQGTQGSGQAGERPRDGKDQSAKERDKGKDMNANTTRSPGEPPSAVDIARQRALLDSMERAALKSSTGDGLRTDAPSASPNSNSKSQRTDSGENKQRTQQKKVRDKSNRTSPDGDKQTKDNDGAKASVASGDYGTKIATSPNSSDESSNEE
jgi:hypothetical protein